MAESGKGKGFWAITAESRARLFLDGKKGRVLRNDAEARNQKVK